MKLPTSDFPVPVAPTINIKGLGGFIRRNLFTQEGPIVDLTLTRMHHAVIDLRTLRKCSPSRSHESLELVSNPTSFSSLDSNLLK